MEIFFSIDQLDDVITSILNQNPSKIILFDAEMGVGKTTIIKSLVKKLGVEDKASSPTFSLVNEYRSIDNSSIFHFDLYRLKNIEEALDMGIDEYLYSGNWCFIEWPEKFFSIIPEEHTLIKIKTLEDGRRHLTMKNSIK